MDPTTHKIDASNHRLRRVGRLARRRLRIEGENLTNGVHTDGRLSVVISGLGADGASSPATFQWWASRPLALVIVRAGVDGDDVTFSPGPVRWGSVTQRPGDDRGISYIAFAYDTERDTSTPHAPARARTPVATLLARMLRSAAPA